MIHGHGRSGVSECGSVCHKVLLGHRRSLDMLKDLTFARQVVVHIVRAIKVGGNIDSRLSYTSS